MNTIMGQVKALIVRMNADRGWNRDFTQMTPDSKLREFGIYHFRERSVLFNLFGSYIDIVALKEAVIAEFRLQEYKDLKQLYYKWSLVADVAEYVRLCKSRKEEENRRRQERSERAKAAWVRRKAREQHQREERAKKQEHERRSKPTENNSSVREYWLRILDLPPQASEEEIKTKYRELAKSAHPDHGGHPHHFRVIQMAYENLMDRSRR